MSLFIHAQYAKVTKKIRGFNGVLMRDLLLNWIPNKEYKTIGYLLAMYHHEIPDIEHVVGIMMAKVYTAIVDDPEFEELAQHLHDYKNLTIEKLSTKKLPNIHDFMSGGHDVAGIMNGHSLASIAFRCRNLSVLHQALMAGSDPIMANPLGYDYLYDRVGNDLFHLGYITDSERLSLGYIPRKIMGKDDIGRPWLFVRRLWLFFSNVYRLKGTRYLWRKIEGIRMQSFDEMDTDGEECYFIDGIIAQLHENISHEKQHGTCFEAFSGMKDYLAIYIEHIQFHHYKYDGWVSFLGLCVIILDDASWLNRLLERARNHHGDPWFFKATKTFIEHQAQGFIDYRESRPLDGMVR